MLMILKIVPWAILTLRNTSSRVILSSSKAFLIDSMVEARFPSKFAKCINAVEINLDWAPIKIKTISLKM